MRKRIYLYVGYYEMFITDVPMPKPYTLISRHWSVEAAERAAEKAHPGDNYYFKADLYPDYYQYVLDGFAMNGEEIPTSEINGEIFYII